MSDPGLGNVINISSVSIYSIALSASLNIIAERQLLSQEQHQQHLAMKERGPIKPNQA